MFVGIQHFASTRRENKEATHSRGSRWSDTSSPPRSSRHCTDTTHSPSHRSSSGTAHSATTPQRHHSFKIRVISTPVIYLYFTIRMQVHESNACASHSKATQQICQSQNLSKNYFGVFPLLTSIKTFPQSTQKIKDVKTMCKY